MSDVVVYNDGELELKISVNEETIWLNQVQISELFETSTDNISLHLKNIYKEKELAENSTIEDFSVVRQDGQIFDAYALLSDLIKSAKVSIILIDNYIDESILTLLSKNQNVQFTLYTHNTSKKLQLDIEKHNKQ